MDSNVFFSEWIKRNDENINFEIQHTFNKIENDYIFINTINNFFIINII